MYLSTKYSCPALPGGELVGFLDQPRGNGRVDFSSKVDNLCEVRIISIPVTTQRYASSAEELSEADVR